MTFIGVAYLLMGLFGISKETPPLLNDRKLDHEHREVTGFITSVDVTHQTPRRGASFYGYNYAFEFTPDGSTGMVSGRYYTKDERANAEKWHAGDKVQIWYLPGNAAVARIKGTDLGNSGGFAGALFLLVLSFGILCVFWWFVIRSRKRLEWLLTNGAVGEFRVTNVALDSGNRYRMARVRMECERADDKTDDGYYCGELFKQPKENMKFAQGLKDSGRTVFGLHDPRERERGKKRRRLEIPEMWFW